MPRKVRTRQKLVQVRAKVNQPQAQVSKSQASPITTVSTEVLLWVFAIFIRAPQEAGTDWRSRLDRHAVLALVCRFWKEALYGCKVLWADIDFTQRR